MKQNDNIKTIPEKLEKTTITEDNKEFYNIENKSFCVIDPKTSNVSIYYRVYDWIDLKNYNQFVKFSFYGNAELANGLKGKKNMKDVEEVIKKELNNLQNTAKVSCLALEYKDGKQPPFDERIIRKMKNIQLNEIKADYFSEDFFDCGNDCNKAIRYSLEPIIQILYENKIQDIYNDLVEKQWTQSYEHRRIIMNMLIGAKVTNLAKTMEDEPWKALGKYIKEKQNLINELQNDIKKAMDNALKTYQANLRDNNKPPEKVKNNSSFFSCCCGAGDVDKEEIVNQVKEEELLNKEIINNNSGPSNTINK